MSKSISSPDIAFLIRSGFSASALMQIARAAAESGVYPHEHALMNGLISEQAYYSALAKACNLSFLVDLGSVGFPQHPKTAEIGIACRAGLIRIERGDRNSYLTAPYGRDLLLLLQRLSETPSMTKSFTLTTHYSLRTALLQRNTAPVLDYAINRLHDMRPADSARRSYDSFFAALLIGILAIAISVLYRAPLFAPLFGAICASLYLLACYFRILAYADYHELRVARVPNLSDKALPVCSVLVPIYKEAKLVPQLLEAFAQIDYPRSKLDILFLIEESDAETAYALRQARLPPECRVIVAPEGQPRTKPRALQIGLSFARGEMVTIFDAEDVPHPQQLRHAARQLHAGGPRMGCVQAQLRIDNAEASWLSKQFALEYAALFTVFLPSLAKRGFPLLLGGTSNYFRTHVLRSVGGWDPWNVTEDADLGIRLARAGFHVGTCETPTEEEAPVTLKNWLRQRMRWQKGWMQTLAVHFSQIGTMQKEMGMWNVLALVATLGVTLLSAFAYPITLVWVLLDAVLGLKTYGVNMLGATVFGACLAAFIGGNLFPLLHLHAGAKRAGFRFDLLSVCTVWIYWLLISISAYGALYDLARSPYRWFKTEHSGREKEQAKPNNLRRFFNLRRARPVRKTPLLAPAFQLAPRPIIRFADLARGKPA